MVKNKLWIGISIACLLLGWNHLNAIVGFGGGSNDSNTENQLNILSYNVRYFKVGKHTIPERIEQAEKILALPAVKEADIFCGQELGYPTFSKSLDKTVDILMQAPKQHYSNQKGLLIVSKYPIINKGELDLGNQEELNSCIFVDIQIDNNTIFRIYNLHLKSNKVSGTTEQMKIDTEELKKRGFWQNVKSIIRSYRDASKIRATQSELIAEHIKGSPYPVVVCGDFNDPPVSYAYAQLIENLQDTFCKQGSGLGTTYAGNIPFLRIDYIFADKRFRVKEYEKLNVHYSDHFPISSQLTY